MIRRLAGAIFAGALLTSFAVAQTNDAALVVRGVVEHPLNLTLSDLQTMPRTKLTVKEKDGGEATFEGVALFEVIDRAKPVLSEKCCSNTINTVVLIGAADKYQVIFSLPELDSKFSREKILLADRREGQPLDAAHGPLQIIVPDEKVHARWVRQVKVIDILPVGSLPGTTNSSPH